MAVPLDIQAYLIEKVKEEDEDFELREGAVFVDFFIKPLVIILQPIRNEIETIRFLQSLENFQSMSDAELDSLLANIFLPRRTGSNATGTVRLFFSAPQASTITEGSGVTSVDGLTFLVDEDTSLTSAAMSFNLDGALYYMDAPVTAQAPGTAYNIVQGGIVALEVPLSGVVRVTNLSAFSGGIATESNTEYFNRGQQAVTIRNLINDRSIPTVILATFSFVQSVTPIGFNDPEMLRAGLTVVLPGPPQHVVTIKDRGGHADVYIEGDAFEEKSVSVQAAPDFISTNTLRGVVTLLDFGFRKISVTGGYFNGVFYPGDAEVQLLPNVRYTLFLALTPGNQYELSFLTDIITNPFPSVPGGGIPIAELETNGAAVISLSDTRTNAFQFERPVISMDSAELLDAVSLQPTGVVLRDGSTELVPPSVVAEPGHLPHMALSRGSGDVHFVYKKVDGVYYQRLDSLGNVVQVETQISSELNATNLRVSANLQEDLNVFFLDFPGNLRHLKIDNTGGNLVVENTISVSGATSQFEVKTTNRGNVEILLINDDLGQLDPYYIRTDEDGTVTTAQVNLESTAGDTSDPDIDFAQTVLDIEITGAPGFAVSEGTAGATSGLPDGVFTDSTADFNASGGVPGTDAVLAGDTLIIIEDTALPSELGAYPILSVDPGGTFVTLTGLPTLTAASGIRYEIIRGTGDRMGVWADDVSGDRNVRAAAFDTTGTVLLGGQTLVLSAPDAGLDNRLPRVTRRDFGTDSFVIMWVNNGTEVEVLTLAGLASAVVSTTGDTQGTGSSRVFLDASNPFFPTDVGRYISVFSGSGLVDSDFRLYEILTYVSAGQVLTDIPVANSTAADINYVIVDAPLAPARQLLSQNFFLNQITSLDVALDNSGNLHVGLIETDGNKGKTFLGKFTPGLDPLFKLVFLRVSASANNRESINLEVDAIRQPYLSWGDFSASLGQVQFAKFQAQEFAYIVNSPGESLSIKEDASIIVDPSLIGQAIRFNYTHSARVPEVDAYVNDTVNRVIIGNYCTRHTLPAYVDVNIEYSGDNAPTEEAALELVTNFINSVGSDALPPSVAAVVTNSTVGDSVEKSDLLDLLYDNGADYAKVDSEIRVDELQQDGTFRTKRSVDKVTISRTARFISRTISVTQV